MRKLTHMTEQTGMLDVQGVEPAWTLADHLRKAREFAGLSQAALAERMGVTRDVVTNYESGRTTPRRPVLITWALATGVSYHWLIAPDRMDGTQPITGRFLVRVQAQERATPAAAAMRRRSPRLPESLSA